MDLTRFDYGVLTLLLKRVDADKIQPYMPICLCNALLILFTKIINNVAILVADNIILPV